MTTFKKMKKNMFLRGLKKQKHIIDKIISKFIITQLNICSNINLNFINIYYFLKNFFNLFKFF